METKARAWRWLRGLSFLAMVMMVYLLPNQAQADTKRWVGDSGWWDVNSNWTPPGQPMAGDVVLLMQGDARNRKVRYRNKDYSGDLLDYLGINASGTGTMTLYLGRDALNVNYEQIAIGDELGSPNTGNVLQRRGVHKVGNLFLGVNPGCTGTYELKGGDLEELDTGYLGYFGNAIFTQTGGTHTTYMLYLGYQADSVSTYNLSRGRLGLEIPSWPLWNQERIGYYGTGTFNQTGGTHNAIGVILGSKTGSSGTYNQSGGSHTTNILYLGEEAGSSGVYNLGGGSLEVISASPLLFYIAEKIGVQGEGSFTQTGGTHYVNGNLVLGEEAGSKGIYNLSGGSLNEILGPQIGWLGRGTFIQTDGGHQIRDRFFMGCGSGSEGTYELHGGTLSAGFEDIGVSGQGVFTQTGGTNTVIYGDPAIRTGELLIGDFAGGIGTYNLRGGSLSNYSTTIGVEGTGTFIQTAGTHTIDQQLILGSDAGSTGTYELRGGSLSSYTSTVGLRGTGSFLQTGGTNVVATQLTLNNTYNLRAGDLTTGSMYLNSGGIFNQEGGSLNCGYLDNSGTVTLTDGTSEIHGFINRTTGVAEIANSAAFYGPTINHGTIKATDTTVTWVGTLINLGTYISDPATQIFNNLIVLPGGVIVAGPGDYFLIKEDFINLSNANQAWNTQAACLRFIKGTDTRHSLYLPGLDSGDAMGGYFNNFAWGCLDLTGQQLSLLDGNQIPGGALYVGEILGVQWDKEDLVTNIFGNNLNIYYDPLLPGNQYLDYLTFKLEGGGSLMPMTINVIDSGYPMHTPLPPSAWLFLSGLAGLGLLRRSKKLWKS
jgi:hypothetical protein